MSKNSLTLPDAQVQAASRSKKEKKDVFIIVDGDGECTLSPIPAPGVLMCYRNGGQIALEHVVIKEKKTKTKAEKPAKRAGTVGGKPAKVTVSPPTIEIDVDWDDDEDEIPPYAGLKKKPTPAVEPKGKRGTKGKHFKPTVDEETPQTKSGRTKGKAPNKKKLVTVATTRSGQEKYREITDPKVSPYTIKLAVVKDVTFKGAVKKFRATKETRGICIVAGKEYAINSGNMWAIRKVAVATGKAGMILYFPKRKGYMVFHKKDYNRVLGKILKSPTFEKRGVYQQPEIPKWQIAEFFKKLD